MDRPFEWIVAEYGPMVLRVCRAVVGPDDAEDAWSETFLAALRAYPTLPPDSDVRAWLVTIAHRRAVDQVRARARRAVPVGELPDAPARGSGPDRWHGDLWDAMRALPATQRAAVAYHHLAGMPYAQVAAVLGSSEAAARRAAADGLARLRSTYRTGDDL